MGSLITTAQKQVTINAYKFFKHITFLYIIICDENIETSIHNVKTVQ